VTRAEIERCRQIARSVGRGDYTCLRDGGEQLVFAYARELVVTPAELMRSWANTSAAKPTPPRNSPYQKSPGRRGPERDLPDDSDDAPPEPDGDGDDDDDDDDACACACAECRDGRCEDCSNPLCRDPNCEHGDSDDDDFD
jgi:hypothetical protein